MTEHEVRDTIGTAALPRPRAARDDTAWSGGAGEEPRRLTAGFPWPEPWQFCRAARPRTEFWDVATAGWRSSGSPTRSGTGD